MVLEELGRRSVSGERARFFIFLDHLQPQTMCVYYGMQPGKPPRSDVAAQIIEVAPGLDIEPLTDVALKHTEVCAPAFSSWSGSSATSVPGPPTR